MQVGLSTQHESLALSGSSESHISYFDYTQHDKMSPWILPSPTAFAQKH